MPSNANPKEMIFKRYMLQLGVFLFALVELYFGVQNFQRQAYTQMSLDGVAFVLLLVALVLARYGFMKWAGRMVLMTLMSLFSLGVLAMSHSVAVLLWFYTLPPVLFFLLGLKEGVLWSLLLALPMGVLLACPGCFVESPLGGGFVLHVSATFALSLITYGVLNWLRCSSLNTLEEINGRLEESTQRLETLGNLVPICSYCKKLKDPHGYWQQLESFLARNTKADISVGVCDSCREKGLVTNERTVIGRHTLTFPKMRQPKHLFVLVASLFVAVTTLIFTLRDVLLGNYLKALFQSLLTTTLLVSAWLQYARRGYKSLRHLLVFSILLIMVLPFLGHRPEPIEIVWFLLFPPLASYIVGFTWGIVWGGVVGGLIALIFWGNPLLGGLPYNQGVQVVFSIVYGVNTIITLGVERLRGIYSRRAKERRRKLKQAYSSISTLKGMVPVCEHCKAIRDDDGFWTSLEKHLLKNTDLTLSHGICHDCMEREFPELVKELPQEEKTRTLRPGSFAPPLVKD